ncbi:MAG: 3-oxoacyl-ACP reductase [Hyphomicrobiales bacterium]|nr:MAG: 3-oxoacyl-ACP reductase [Hyphomicrobiales bacterium]
MSLGNKIAVITGAASGFGEAIARRFVAEGARVVIVDLNEEAGNRVAEDLGDKAIFHKADVSSADDVEAMIWAAEREWGGVDILVNNAGFTHRNKPVTEVSEAEFDRIFAVNVKAIYLGANAVIPRFRARGGGVILNVASTAGVRPRPNLAVYNASKGAAITLTKSLAVELAPDKIRVVALNPVAGETGMLHLFMGEDTPEKRAQFQASVPLGRLSQPVDIANAALFLCSSEAEFLTGVALEVDGGRCI